MMNRDISVSKVILMNRDMRVGKVIFHAPDWAGDTKVD